MSASTLVARGRQRAEALMVDRCTIRRKGGPVTDTTTGDVTWPTTTIYTGKCRFQQRRAVDARTEDAGEAYVRMLRMDVHLPMTATGLKALDEVTCDTSALDPDLPGRVFIVRDLAHKTHATARRVRAEERT